MSTVHRYISRIRNKAKQQYAKDYLAWYDRARLDLDNEPNRGSLSYMAAQAVRMEIHKLVHSKGV